jgi:hypothetical protein
MSRQQASEGSVSNNVSRNSTLKSKKSMGASSKPKHSLSSSVANDPRFLALKAVFAEPPKGAPDPAREQWGVIGPLGLEGYLQSGMLVFNPDLEVRKVSEYYHGQLDENGHASGIGRGTWPGGGVYEGAWARNNRNGFGRDIWGDGSVYEGECRDGHVHGYGKKVQPGGETGEGYWDNNELISLVGSGNKGQSGAAGAKAPKAQVP